VGDRGYYGIARMGGVDVTRMDQNFKRMMA
jgi:hypothetical protein